MFSRILVPLDGSAQAERALPVAARIARASGAHLLLVRAVTLPVSFGLAYEEGRVQWHLMRDESATAQDYLSTIARSDTLAALPVETFVAMGAAASVILDVSAEREIDLVVLTSHGQSGVLRWMMGSVAGHVVHDSLAPVLVLRATDEGESSAERESGGESERQGGGGTEGPLPLRVLVPMDGSPLAETALAPAAALGRALSGSRPVAVMLLMVVTPYEELATNTPTTLLVDSAQGYLDRVVQRLRAEWHDAVDAGQLAITASIAVQRDVASAILAAAAGGVETEETGAAGVGAAGRAEAPAGCDLVALTTHGRSGIARWALGSVTERLLHTASAPLLVVRPPTQSP